MKNLMVRTLSGLVLVAVFVGAVLGSQWSFGALLLLILVGGQTEFYKLARETGLSPQRWMGLAVGVLLFALNFIVFRQFSRSFNQMLERLDEGFTAQRQFTGNAAHELRTPLSLMQAQLELFSAEHPEVSRETSDFLRLLREQTERMTQMTKTLLEMSELKTVPCTDRIELAPMVEEIFADLAPLADRNGIILESEGDGAMIGSDTLIYRMLFNLTENSIRYNRPNGTVRIMITDEKNRLVIRVTDTGCGIPPEKRKRVFERFEKLNEYAQGTGLGLSICKLIVEKWGGRIWIDSQYTRGARFVFTHPLDL